jgi:hypothetical protein
MTGIVKTWDRSEALLARLRMNWVGAGLPLGREDEDLVGGDPVGVANHIMVALKDLRPAAGIS